MRYTDHNTSDNDNDRQGRGGRGGRRRPSFGEAVGPGFVPGFPPGDQDEGGRPHRGRGRGGHGGRGFGPGGPRGRRGRGGGRPRGDVRAAILLLLEEGPRHGYQLIQDISERSNGTWTPSAGSIYPTLQVLEDEGLVTIEPVDGRKTASLTEAGGTYVTENRERLGVPWEQLEGDGSNVFALREAMMGLADASKQVFRVGSADQQRRAAQTLTDARTAIYGILAEDGESAEG